jgi:UDP-N-acetylglucosamine transferase subunit ALG13
VIVALIGTNPYSFDRMVRPLDEAAGRNGWDVFIQLGHTRYEPRHCRFERFLERDRLLGLIEKAELLVTQGGFGSIREALQYAKPVVAVPRKPELKESQDHQEELVRELEAMGYVLGVYDASQMERAIEKARTFVPASRKESRIPRIIGEFLSKL